MVQTTNEQNKSFTETLKSIPKIIGKGILNFFVGIVMWFVNLFKKIIFGTKNTAIDVKNNPKSGLNGLLSAIIPGLGQLRNKQYYKAGIFFGIFLFIVLVELLTGEYFSAAADLEKYPLGEGEKLYFFRDYGGFILGGLWGLLTLGTFVVGDQYRGFTLGLIHEDGTPSWAVADLSEELLGLGIMALVLFSVFIVIYIINIKDAYKTNKLISAGEQLPTREEYRKLLIEELFSLILITPAIILILIFTLVPFLYSFSIAFTDYDSPTAVTQAKELISWIGFGMFKEVFQDDTIKSLFFNVLGWTIIYAFMSSVTVYIIGMITALALNSEFVKGKKYLRILLIIPWAIPALVVLMAFRNVFSPGGLADTLLDDLNLLEPVKRIAVNLGLIAGPESHNADYFYNQSISWFLDTGSGGMAKLIIILVNLWIGAPYFMMLITGILGTVPDSLYEAADIDGAGDRQKLRFITFPWVLKATIPVLISTFTFNFNNFGAIYFLTGGEPQYPIEVTGGVAGAPGQTDILISWIYKLTFDFDLYNQGAVYSILIFMFVGFFAVWNLSKVKSFWEED